MRKKLVLIQGFYVETVDIIGGELYVLTLLVDAMRSVKGFHLDKAAASVLTTSITLTGQGIEILYYIKLTKRTLK